MRYFVKKWMMMSVLGPRIYMFQMFLITRVEFMVVIPRCSEVK